MKTISFITLGCRSNQAETDEMKEAAESKGYAVVEKGSKAGVVVINTCTVTALADKKSRQAIRSAIKSGAKVIVTGCMENASIEGVVLKIPNKDKSRFKDLLPSPETFSSTLPSPLPEPLPVPRIRANLLIQTGCNNFCAYCIVPYARGREKSRDFDECLERARKLVGSGIKEIVLTGTNVGAFDRLPDLIDGLSGNGIPLTVNGKQPERIRLSSIEPNNINDNLIDTIASNKNVCRFLHIPLQSGDDAVLKAMGRKYTAGEYLALIERIRNKIPGIAISTDVIAGFPGETDEQFQSTVELAKNIGFSRIHVFRYSKRKGTPAAGMKGQLDPKVIASRADIMQKTRDSLMLSYHKSLIGKTVDVLIEQQDKKTGLLEGLTDTFVRVFMKGRNELIGQAVPANIFEASTEYTKGNLVDGWGG